MVWQKVWEMLVQSSLIMGLYPRTEPVYRTELIGHCFVGIHRSLLREFVVNHRRPKNLWIRAFLSTRIPRCSGFYLQKYLPNFPLIAFLGWFLGYFVPSSWKLYYQNRWLFQINMTLFNILWNLTKIFLS